MELNSTNVCIFYILRKFGHHDARIWVNMVNVMNKIREICSLRLKEMSKFVAKYGGYCRKLGKNMVDIDGYLADIIERI